ncbi:DUF4381 family protein [Haloferula sargassicola]|uniref:DUF4381 domain-containing protein n=1 Tax=Haloferula sargassicola TaxID=490096 RepID=A0ABP9UHE9_9BACT
MKAVLRHTALLVVASGALLAQETEDIRGPKPLIEIPEPPQATPWMTYGLIALLAVAVIVVLVWLLRRKSVEVLTPEQRARKELDVLRNDGRGMAAGDFAEAASGVLRRFIEQRFGVAAPKRTTEEFLHEVTRGSHGLEDRIDSLRGFLRSCDMAKFAAEELDELQRDDLLVKARGFINTPVRKEDAA